MIIIIDNNADYNNRIIIARVDDGRRESGTPHNTAGDSRIRDVRVASTSKQRCAFFNRKLVTNQRRIDVGN